MTLDKMKNSGFDFSKVVALSGDGQVRVCLYFQSIFFARDVDKIPLDKNPFALICG